MHIDLNNEPAKMGSRISELEIIDESGNVVNRYGPWDNAVTDKMFADFDTNQSSLLFLSAGMTFSTGVWYPIKYRGPSTATITGNILYAPGLLADYGVDTSGVGYVNAPSLTGKVVKFDTGEEYYISGVNGGDIVLRNGGRIMKSLDYYFGSFQSAYPSWFFPSISSDISTPTNYTVWDVGSMNYKRTYLDSFASKYGNNSITTTTVFSASNTVIDSVTGVWGAFSGKYSIKRRLETETLAANAIIGKISIRGNEDGGGGSLCNFPFAHLNLEGGISVLSGQKVRAQYELILDLNPSISGMNNTSESFIDGWPTSSGYFVPYGYSIPNAPLLGGVSFSNNAVLFSQYKFPTCTALSSNLQMRVIPIFSGMPGYSFSFSNGMSISDAQNPTGSINKITVVQSSTSSAPLSPSSLSFGSASGNCIISGSKIKRTGGFYVDINNWNMNYLLGFAFTDTTYNAMSSAFWFHQPQQKLGTHELSVSMESYGIQRTLIN